AGSRYWVFKDTLVESGYPRPLSDFGLGRDGVDGAFVWPHNGKTYLFRGSQFWRFDEKAGRMDSGYPRNSGLWKGVPADIDDIISWVNGDTYFFKGSHYWRFRGGNVEAEPGYPRSTARDWMYCQSVSENTPTDAPEGRGQRDCNCNCPAGTSYAPHSPRPGVFWLALALTLLLRC
ncbi:hypothetical protein FKM82_019862, partial [Ascaphus truei]